MVLIYQYRIGAGGVEPATLRMKAARPEPLDHAPILIGGMRFELTFSWLKAKVPEPLEDPPIFYFFKLSAIASVRSKNR